MSLERVGNDVFARLLFVLGDEAPASLAEVPVDDGKGNKVFKALQLPCNKGAMSLSKVSAATVTHAIRHNRPGDLPTDRRS